MGNSDGGMHRIVDIGHAGQINVLIDAEFVGIFAEEGHQFHHYFQHSAWKESVIQLLGFESRSSFRELRWVPGGGKGFDRRVINSNMVGMAVTSDRIVSN